MGFAGQCCLAHINGQPAARRHRAVVSPEPSPAQNRAPADPPRRSPTKPSSCALGPTAKSKCEHIGPARPPSRFLDLTPHCVLLGHQPGPATTTASLPLGGCTRERPSQPSPSSLSPTSVTTLTDTWHSPYMSFWLRPTSPHWDISFPRTETSAWSPAECPLHRAMPGA